MATIAEQLTELQTVKSGLKTALINDGTDMSAVPFTGYPGKVQAMSDRWYDFLNTTCTEIDLSGLSTIRSYMCFEYKNLETIKNMDKMLTNTIGLSAFMGCTALKNVVITENVVMLRSTAFDGCTSLQRLVIGSNVFNLGSSRSLNIGSEALPATVIMKPTTPPIISTSTFGNYVTRIVVPYESRINYALETNWAAHQSQLEVRLAVSISEGAVNLDQDILDGDVSTYLYRAEAVENTEETGSKTIYCYTNNATVGQEYGSNISNVSSLVFEANPDAKGVSA